jgi:hypothetical protein
MGLLVLSNAVLQTRTVRGWIEAKLEERTGFRWSIQSVAWSPWTGLQVREVAAEFQNLQPGSVARPLFFSDDVDVQIHWRGLLDGELALKEVRLRSGRIAIPLQVASLLPTGPAQEPAAEGPEKSPGEERPASPPRRPTRRPGAQPKTPPDERAAEKKPNRKPPPDAVAKSRAPAGHPLRLILDGCEVSLYSLEGRGKGGLALKNVRGELPLAGEDRAGWLESAGVAFGGDMLTESLRTPVVWNRPFLIVPGASFVWAGLEVGFEAAVRTRGIPRFRVEFGAPVASTEAVPVPVWSGLEWGAQTVRLSGRMDGVLSDLNSWEGRGLLEVADLNFKHKGRGESRQFERGSVAMVMQRGVLRIVDARLLSEPLSFLGNAVMLPDGRLRGVMRVVADREHAEAITRIVVGATLTGGWTRSWFEPLMTPDRQFRDLHVQGTFGEATVDVGRKGEELGVDQVWDRMVAFVASEEAETEEGVPSSRPREQLLP